MLAREDKRKIPIALIPNGSGDDLCSSVGIWSIDHALDYICKGECTPLDSIRFLMDHESEDTLPEESEERSQLCRHMDVNAGVAIIGKITHGAIPFKNCCGKTSYKISTLSQYCKGNFVAENFEMEVDGQKIEGFTDLQSISLMFTNGKYTGGGMVINPFSCMNDGLVNVTWMSDPRMQSLMGVAGILDQAKEQHGIQAYAGTSVYMRGRKIKLTYKGRDNDPKDKVYAE